MRKRASVILMKGMGVSDILPIAEAIARRAGAVVREGFGQGRQVQHKGVIDLVTEFDRHSEEVIGIKPWDIAAGGLLVREAGGRTTSTEGDEDSVPTATIVASNGLLHDQILRVLREGDNAPLPQ